MKILAIESSAKAASVAVCDDNKLIAQYFQNSGLTHSRTLLKMAEDMLNNLDMKVSNLDIVAVAAGPGSFTGVRIGVSATIGLAWGADLPVCGVSTLEAMAYHSFDPNYITCPVMDARRSEVYTASFDFAPGCISRLCPDQAISIAELAEHARVAPKPLMFFGDGAEMCYEALTKAGIACRLAPPLLRLQSAWGVACLALTAPQVSPNELTPNYIRVSQAERERQTRLGHSG